MGGKIYDVVWVSIYTTCGMNAYLYHIVGLSMLDAEDHNTCMRGVYVRMYRTAKEYKNQAAVGVALANLLIDAHG